MAAKKIRFIDRFNIGDISTAVLAQGCSIRISKPLNEDEHVELVRGATNESSARELTFEDGDRVLFCIVPNDVLKVTGDTENPVKWFLLTITCRGE